MTTTEWRMGSNIKPIYVTYFKSREIFSHTIHIYVSIYPCDALYLSILCGRGKKIKSDEENLRENYSV